uniref:Uncharacterized protein n=1 Tax=Rhizophora mucronata TaxID=61149 RepID=A0A2P2NBG0_RHIMU
MATNCDDRKMAKYAKDMQKHFRRPRMKLWSELSF